MSLGLSWQPKNTAIRRWIDYKIHKLRRSMNIATTGGTGDKLGIGKSVFSLKYGETSEDRYFNIDRVTYLPKDFLYQYNRIREDPHPGQVIISDEAEELAANSSYHSMMNHIVSHTMATSRYVRAVAFFNMPTFSSWLDKRIRLLFNAWAVANTTYEPEKGLWGYIKFYRITTDLVGEKVRPRKLKFFDYTNRVWVKPKYYKVELPSEELMAQYEKKSRQFKDQIGLKLYEKAKKFEEDLEKEYGTSTITSKANFYVEKALANPEITKTLHEKGKVGMNLLQFSFPELSDKLAAKLAYHINRNWSGKETR